MEFLHYFPVILRVSLLLSQEYFGSIPLKENQLSHLVISVYQKYMYQGRYNELIDCLLELVFGDQREQHYRLD